MRVILLTGPGGAGTTTISAATALALAESGQQVVLGAVEDASELIGLVGTTEEVDPANRVAPAEHVDSRGAGSVTAAGSPPSGLATSPHLRDPSGGSVTVLRSALSNPSTPWGRSQEALLPLLIKTGFDPVLAEEAPLLPGLGQVRALLRLLETLRHSPADVAVVDLGAIRQATELLQVSGRLIWTLRRVIEGPSDSAAVFRPLTRMAGATPLMAARFVAGALSRLETLDRILRSEQSRLRLVIGSSAAGKRQVARLIPTLSLAGMRVDAVIVNRSRGPGGNAAGSDPDAGAAWLPEVVRLHVPPGRTEPNDAAGLARLVHRQADALADLTRSATVLAPTVETVGSTWVLRIPTGPALDVDPQVHRRGDDLLITVSGQRLLLPLWGALRRCRITTAAVEGASLVFTFHPEGW